MKTSEMMPSKYLKQSDFDEHGTILTIHHLKKQNVAKEDDPAELRWVLFFEETGDKGMVLNNTNIGACEKAVGSDDTDDWVSQEVVIYVDPNVAYGGKVTGGLRIRAHRRTQAPRPMANRATHQDRQEQDKDTSPAFGAPRAPSRPPQSIDAASHKPSAYASSKHDDDIPF